MSNNTIERVRALQATQAAEREEKRLTKDAHRQAEIEAFAPLKKMADDVRDLPLAGKWKSYAGYRETCVGDKFSSISSSDRCLDSYGILGNYGDRFSADYNPSTGKVDIQYSHVKGQCVVVTMEEAQERLIELVARMTSEVWP